MTPIHFTGDISLLQDAGFPCESRGDACVVGLHTIFPGQWLIEDNGFRVLDDSDYRRWQAEREVAETLYWRAA